MSAPERSVDGAEPAWPVDGSVQVVRSTRRRGWSCGQTAVLLGALVYVLLPIAYATVVLSAAGSMGGITSITPEERRLATIAVVLAVLTIGCAIGAVVVGCVVLVRGWRDPAFAWIGVVLGLIPFLGVVALVFASRS
ncbi:hypothetical protein [Cellulomonas sp. URHD0024]|uniref:hypothetical protein n=1 Tax=Cellulomonas sp. URHD0024 TaxID=1302620 RepID=UPI00040629D1|nr:hypothetical protein [Cellulomonas sp. URHD0024]